ncbi:hypothetical protein SLS63_000661 [Diaporthe eres]|uniref:Uncharacterized protein n=1 Tax=Diaporthe eres TaxID=83184 RepID=A0ABR1PMU7_DIAER
MNPKNKACPEGEGVPSRQTRRDAANIFASRETDDIHQQDKQAAGRKRQATIDPDGQRRQKAMKSQDDTTVDDVHDANNIPVKVRPESIHTWQGTNVATPSPYGNGFISHTDPSTTDGQELLQTMADILAKWSPTKEVITYMAPAVKGDKNRAAFTPSDLCEMNNELKRAIEESNLEIQNRRLRESVGQSASDRDETAADEGNEARCAGPLTGPGHGWYPDWQKVLDAEELSKSRFLEDEPAHNFLRSLEPRIIDASHGYFGPHTLYLHLARMANIAQRRERFQEYLVEAPRQWYCLTTVCKQGYENENALAIEENCRCPLEKKTCLQVCIQRGKLGFFDVRFR